MSILTPHDLTREQAAAAAQLQAQETQATLIGLDVAKRLLPITLQHALETAEQGESQRREDLYRQQLAEKKAELAEQFAGEEVEQAALLAVSYPPRSSQVMVNVGQAVNLANHVASLLLHSRGLPVPRWEQLTTAALEPDA